MKQYHLRFSNIICPVSDLDLISESRSLPMDRFQERAMNNI